MGDANVRLFGPTQIGLWNEYVSHAQHAETAQLFRCVKNDGRKTWRHLRVQTDFDTSLNFILTFHQQVEQFLCVDNGLTEIGHQTDQSRIPFVDDFSERRRTGCHQNLPNSIVESAQGFVVDAQETLSRSFLGDFVL